MRIGNCSRPLLLAASLVLAALDPVWAAPEKAASEPALRAPEAVARAAELRAARDAGVSAIAELRARLRATSSPAEAQALRRRITRAKLETEASLLRLQAGWARSDGRLDVAAQLERDAASLLAPRPRDPAAAARRGAAK